MSDGRVTGTLSASGQTAACHGRRLDILLSGTWVGTVKLQRYTQGAWVDTTDSWTANDFIVVDGATPADYRLDFTRSSGSVVYEMTGTLL